jgi:hypothetical protein
MHFPIGLLRVHPDQYEDTKVKEGSYFMKDTVTQTERWDWGWRGVQGICVG